MAITLSKQTAQKIVDTIKDVCGHDINYINTNGIIFASTNPSRIGDFHEIGKKVVETKETIEIVSDNSFYGTHKGVNIPFLYNRDVIAAIGISGEPDKVRQYAILAQKITSLILREQEIDSMNYGRKNRLNYFIRALVEHREINHNYLNEFLGEYKLKMDTVCRTVVVKLNPRYNISNISLIENRVYKVFDNMSAKLYTFNFPNEYVLIIPEVEYTKWSYLFYSLAETFINIIYVGIGNKSSLLKQYNSYESAKLALNSLSGQKNIAAFDDLDLEILLGCVSEQAKKEYLKKTVNNLNQEDIELLKVYFSTDMSLKKTAETLFLHKNTLQYKLNRIEKLTGCNPRVFGTALRLFLGISLL